MKKVLFLLCLTCGIVWMSQGYASCKLFKDFYLGLDGGWGSSLSPSKKAVGGGVVGTTSWSRGLDIRAGYLVGASVGRLFGPSFRADVSYSFLSNPAKWESQVSSNYRPYDAQLHSHLILINGYYHLNCLNNCIGFSPYICGGIGTAMNHLGVVDERNQPGDLVATIDSHTQCNFGARFGLGFLKPFCHWALDTGFHLNYIGDVFTGNHRQQFTPADTQLIVPYEHVNNWIFTFYVGIKYKI